MRFDAILNYGLNEIEAQAYKICVYWEDIAKHELPNYRVAKLPAGDPRNKCFLFKCCMKLVRETQGLLPENMYKYYVYAQLTALRDFSDGKQHALIEPQCLFGKMAWLRWKMWKYKFDKQKKSDEFKNTTIDIVQNFGSIVSELTKTKNFLLTKTDLSKESLEKVIESKDFQKWSAFNKISPYFIILSKTVKSKIINAEDSFGFDPSLYIKSISLEIIDEFKNIFGDL